VPERMRSKRRGEEVIHASTNYRPRESSDNAASKADEAVVLPANAALKMDESSGIRSHRPRRPDTGDPQATATTLAVLEAWFLLPLRSFQSWQKIWFRLLLR